MISVSVMGATGYVGMELVRLLSSHEKVKLVHLVSSSTTGDFSAQYPSFRKIPLVELENCDVSTIAKDSDVVFTALPHGASKQAIPALFGTGVKIIDMSGDFRYDDPDVYALWYGEEHCAKDVLAQAVYGLPELHRKRIKTAQLVGNPGCYTTCSILALAPLVSGGLVDPSSIIIDAKSGSTGAGKGVSASMQFCEVNENVKAYNIAKHRHTSEIEQELGNLAKRDVMLSFTPHLLPVNRGILATGYANLTGKLTASEAAKCAADFYKDEPFVDVYPEGLPELKHVVGSNKCAIGYAVDARLGRIVSVSCIDNLIKGAAGQAVQNMNIMFGLDEDTGLRFPAWYL